ncbi:hypothetical protein BDR26DRAFT_131657 [Obelidium mucronatum]|nr:hypothetical protein BDR26DRAFT_131657 [Obelidium mucronatum]
MTASAVRGSITMNSFQAGSCTIETATFQGYSLPVATASTTTTSNTSAKSLKECQLQMATQLGASAFNFNFSDSSNSSASCLSNSFQPSSNPTTQTLLVYTPTKGMVELGHFSADTYIKANLTIPQGKTSPQIQTLKECIKLCESTPSCVFAMYQTKGTSCQLFTMKQTGAPGGSLALSGGYFSVVTNRTCLSASLNSGSSIPSGVDIVGITGKTSSGQLKSNNVGTASSSSSTSTNGTSQARINPSAKQEAVVGPTHEPPKPVLSTPLIASVSVAAFIVVVGAALVFVGYRQRRRRTSARNFDNDGTVHDSFRINYRAGVRRNDTVKGNVNLFRAVSTPTVRVDGDENDIGDDFDVEKAEDQDPTGRIDNQGLARKSTIGRNVNLFKFVSR